MFSSMGGVTELNVTEIANALEAERYLEPLQLALKNQKRRGRDIFTESLDQSEWVRFQNNWNGNGSSHFHHAEDCKSKKKMIGNIGCYTGAHHYFLTQSQMKPLQLLKLIHQLTSAVAAKNAEVIAAIECSKNDKIAFFEKKLVEAQAEIGRLNTKIEEYEHKK